MDEIITLDEAQVDRDAHERGARAALCLIEENTGRPIDRRRTIAWRVRFAQTRARQQARHDANSR